MNNETWCVVDPVKALPYIQKIQSIAIQLSGIQSPSIPPNQHPYRDISELTGSLLRLLSEQQNARQIRHSINRLCKSNLVFYKLMLDFASFQVEGDKFSFRKKSLIMNETKLNQIATELKQAFRRELTSSTPKRRKVIENYLQGSDQSVLDSNRQEFHDLLLEHTVIGTTGPNAYMLGLFGTNQFPGQEMRKKVCPFALETYGLQPNFYSTNGYPMGSSEADKEIYRDACSNDNSWKQQGEQASRSRQNTMKRAASSIQRFFRTPCVRESPNHELFDTDSHQYVPIHFNV